MAARDKVRAEAFAKKHGIEKAYGSYAELLDDPEVDAVYNPVSWNCAYFFFLWKILNEVFGSCLICFILNGR